MTRELHILGGDDRTRYAVEHLAALGWQCRTCAVPNCEDSFALPAPDAARWLLPYPAFRGGHITGTTLPPEALLSCLHRNTLLAGGMFSEISERAQAAGARVIDLAADEALAVSGAVATAEGALGLAIQRLPCTLFGAPCLVVGYGRVGRILSGRLHALGAAVTVAARNPRDRAFVRAMGMAAEVTCTYHKPLNTYRCVFNTVPHPIFTKEQLLQLRPDCIVLELASAPYGIRAADAALLGSRYQVAAGLPGKTAPESAGIQFAEAVNRALEQEEL